MFDVSEEMYGKRVAAVKEFTDREDPQEAFERKYQVLCKNRRKTYYVLCYYGIGGVGKTYFIDKLCRVIDKVPNNKCRVVDEIDCNYIRHSFEGENIGKDVLSILLSLRRKIGKVNSKFGFYRFDAAILSYAKKEELDINIGNENTCIIEENPWLKTTFTIGSITPVGWVFDVLQAIDTVSDIYREHLKKRMSSDEYKAHLEYVNGLAGSNLLKELPRFFIQDMRENMLHVADKPLVVFLDAYERYVDSFEADGVKSTQDYWLRRGHAQSVIRSIPGIMWVITGREKLDWGEDDDWGEEDVEVPLAGLTEEEKLILAEQHLEQHLMGDLSKSDACSFMEKAGIDNEILRNQLYVMTNGTPLFLDISVDLFTELINKGKIPKIEDFGKDYSELIVRYMQNLPLYARELICFFACIGNWTKESLSQILLEVKPPVDYWSRRYQEFLNHSFVIKGKSSEYYIHDTVKKAAYNLADELMKKSIRNTRLQIFEKNRCSTDKTFEKGNDFETYIDYLYNEYATYEEILKKQTIIQEELEKLEQWGNYDACLRTAKIIVKRNIEIVGDRHDATLVAAASLANACSNRGNKKKALELRAHIYSVRKQLLGENDICTLKAYHALGFSYHEMGYIEKALEVRKRVYEKNKELLGEDAPATLSSLHALSLSYYSVGDNEKAMKIRESVYRKRIVLLGENHSDTLWTLHNLAISYSKAGKKEEAFLIREKVYKKRVELLGENHPDTLWSYYSLADSYSESDKKDVALKIRKTIYIARRKILGENHPDTLTSLYSIAQSMFELDKIQQAKNVMKVVCKKRSEILGPNHPDTIKAYKYLEQHKL